MKAAGATGIKSDTPLTDAKMRGGCYASDLMEHARGLERKLSKSEKIIQQLSDSNRVLMQDVKCYREDAEKSLGSVSRRKLPIQLERSLSTNEPDNYSCKIIRPRSTKNNSVSNPKHYTTHSSGIECIQVTQHMNFCLGNAIKYIWRCDDKNDAIEDLEKAIWYINQEIKRRQSCKK